MMTKQVDPKALNAWVTGMLKATKVVGVQAKGDRFVYDVLKKASDLRLDYDVTLLSPKKYFTPPMECLTRAGQGAYSSVMDDEPFVLLGVHPYDLVAILQMDKVFSDTNVDTHYLTRRQSATIVACDVQKLSPNGFSGCMGNATVSKGYDVLLSKVGDLYVVESRTAKGDALLAPLAKAEDADAASLARREQLWEDNRKYLRRHELAMKPMDIPGLLENAADHPVWEEMSKRCFSCGSCNLVCPTCYCFDMRDDTDWSLQTASRSRTWDGCMLKDFATVAGQHNFRKNRMERYRHRYYRKGKYVAEKIGEISCVGCGRCITACVTKIANPVEVYNRLLEVH
jgi:sulfhydrogenase subunit beta (sulfur reductase)